MRTSPPVRRRCVSCTGSDSLADQQWVCGERRLDVFERVHIMGILNVTPDSFSDGGEHFSQSLAIERALRMADEGADIIDIGGESTRPGAEQVPVEEEIKRVIPIVASLSKDMRAAISIDTTKAAVAAAALEAGAVIVNDVSAMRFDSNMTKVVKESGAGVVLMHMLGTPRTMQRDPHYEDVVAEVSESLHRWADEAGENGIARESIAIDPGIGFGKTVQHNLRLLKDLAVLSAPKSTDSRESFRYPLVVGPSRKSFIGATLDVEVGDRVEGTAATVAWSVARGAQVVRVHDVKQMARVVRMTEAIREA